MYCKNCGQALMDGARFCTNCGAPVEEVYPVENVYEEVLPQEEYTPAEYAGEYVEEAYAPAEHVGEYVEEEPAPVEYVGEFVEEESAPVEYSDEHMEEESAPVEYIEEYVEEAPVEEIPAEEGPVAEMPVEEIPVEEIPVVEVPVNEIPVEEIPAEEAPAALCSTCGTPLEDGMAFCTECGTPVSVAAAAVLNHHSHGDLRLFIGGEADEDGVGLSLGADLSGTGFGTHFDIQIPERVGHRAGGGQFQHTYFYQRKFLVAPHFCNVKRILLVCGSLLLRHHLYVQFPAREITFFYCIEKVTSVTFTVVRYDGSSLTIA